MTNSSIKPWLLPEYQSLKRDQDLGEYTTFSLREVLLPNKK